MYSCKLNATIRIRLAVKTEIGIEGNIVIILTNISAIKGPKCSLEKENALNAIPAIITTMTIKVLITGFILNLSKKLKKNRIETTKSNASSI